MNIESQGRLSIGFKSQTCEPSPTKLLFGGCGKMQILVANQKASTQELLSSKDCLGRGVTRLEIQDERWER